MISEQLITHMQHLALALKPELLRWRRHLHAHPELSFEEVATQAYVGEQLAEMGLSARSIAKTGLLLDLHNPTLGASSSCIAVRADLDALPITEVAGRAYGSTHSGVMHACGHDVHTTCAMGAAIILQSIASELPTTVRFLFQPGEELLPGGATHVIADGGLEHPPVAAIIALHVAPDLPVGSLGLRTGPYMASADELYITLLGPGGHGALPHRSVDLVAVLAQMLVSLQQVVSRKAPPEVPTVLSFGKVNTLGGATNILPARIDVEGTLRTYDEVWRKQAHGWIRGIVESTARMYGAEVELRIADGYPTLNNNARVTAELRSIFERNVELSAGFGESGEKASPDAGFGASGEKKSHDAGLGESGEKASPDAGFGASGQKASHDAGFGASGEKESPDAGFGASGQKASHDAGFGASLSPENLGQHGSSGLFQAIEELGIRPTAEDFAWYLQRVPGSFFRLGVANEARGITAGVHTAEFDVDEDCLAIGALALALGALQLAQAQVELSNRTQV